MYIYIILYNVYNVCIYIYCMCISIYLSISIYICIRYTYVYIYKCKIMQRWWRLDMPVEMIGSDHLTVLIMIVLCLERSDAASFRENSLPIRIWQHAPGSGNWVLWGHELFQCLLLLSDSCEIATAGPCGLNLWDSELSRDRTKSRRCCSVLWPHCWWGLWKHRLTWGTFPRKCAN